MKKTKKVKIYKGLIVYDYRKKRRKSYFGAFKGLGSFTQEDKLDSRI